MSDIHQALPYYLNHYTNLTSKVSTRIYPLKLPPECVLPAIFFQEIDTAAKSQSHGEPSFLPAKRFQFTIVSASQIEAYQIASILKTSLDGFRGAMGVNPYTTEVQFSLFKNEAMTDDPEIGLNWLQQDYLIGYKE